MRAFDRVLDFFFIFVLLIILLFYLSPYVLAIKLIYFEQKVINTLNIFIQIKQGSKYIKYKDK